jgi:zinc protease
MRRVDFFQDREMTSFPRASLALAAALLFSVAAVTASSAPKKPLMFHPATARPDAPKALPKEAPRPEKAAKLAPGEWPQAHSDVKADPDVIFGALPNGMRYAIRRQTSPAGQAAVRLYIDAGSLEESDAQQGLAHFLEHMAFEGSKNVPQGEMVKILQRHGLAFGADTNASTGFSQTIYKLDLPHTDEDSLDTALMLMRETASNLTIAPAAVDKQRGIVLSEERTRDTPAYRVYKDRLGFMLPGQRLPSRYPIGKVEVIKSAGAPLIADFYHHYYRPERATLVVAGDFDVKAMEAKIRARFADWAPQGPAGADPDLGQVAARSTEAKLVVEPGAPLSMQIIWMRPPDLSQDTVEKRRRNLMQLLGFQVLNRRFDALARGSNPPFLGAAAFKADQEHSAEATMVAVNSTPDGWKTALEAVEAETHRAAEYGVRQDELDREITELRAALRASVASAATRRPAALADEIANSIASREVVTNPQQDLEFFESAVKGLRAADVSQALAEMFHGSGPLLFVSSPKPIAGGEQALLSALSAAEQAPVAPPVAAAAVAWPYESFGAPGKVVETRDVTDLETTFVRFANGVRLTVKPTKFSEDQVAVRVNIGRGLEDLPPDRQVLSWASGAVIEGGLKKISSEDMERVLAAKVFQANFGVSDDAFVLSGATRREDLSTQLQVLAAYASEPGWRPQGLERIKNAFRTIEDQFQATDSGVLARNLQSLLHSGDQRWTFPGKAEIAATKIEDLQAQIGPHLTGDPIEVVIVGDVSVEDAVKEVARTFGALPPRGAEPPLAGSQMHVAFPGPVAQPVVLTHKGRADQAIGYVAWPTTDFWADPQRAREDAVMGEVLGLRLIDRLREAEGVTYSPSVTYNHSLVWPGWGYVSASVETPPDKLPLFFNEVSKIAADLRAKGPTADELERAKKPRIDAIQKAQVTNQYWLSELSGAQEDPRRLDFVRQLVPGTQRVTAADVQRAAETFLKDATAWKLEVKSEKAK